MAKKNDLGDDDGGGVSLADAAEEALDEFGDGTQEHLPGTNYSKVKFVGMAWETAEVPGLKEEVEFVVRGVVVGHGEDVMADGDIREFAKVKVTSVVRRDQHD